MRAVRVPRERGAWVLFAAGLVSWAVADVYYSAVLVEREVVPVPSLADVLWVAFYPLVYLALLLLLRSRTRSTR